MDSITALAKANVVIAHSRHHATNFKLPAHTAFSIATYGLNLEDLMKSTQGTFDFYNIERIIKPKFILDYKQTLLSLIKSRINKQS